MRSINDIALDSKPIIFLGSSTGMHNQIECCQARNREIVGIIDCDYPLGSELHGLTILDPDEYIKSHQLYEFFVATTWAPFKDPIFIRNQEKRQQLLDFMAYHDLTGATLTGLSASSITGNPTLPTNWFISMGYLIGPNANLTGANLTGINLSNKYLVTINFTNANLTNANLAGANFNSANFSGADLSGAVLTGSDFSYANIRNAIMATSLITGITYTGLVSGPPASLPAGWRWNVGQLING